MRVYRGVYGDTWGFLGFRRLRAWGLDFRIWVCGLASGLEVLGHCLQAG